MTEGQWEFFLMVMHCGGVLISWLNYQGGQRQGMKLAKGEEPVSKRMGIPNAF